MAKKTGANFKHGDKVVACPQAMKDGNKAGQLMSRTGLTAEELTIPMHITKARLDGHIEVKHNRLANPFIVHQKFMTHAQAA